MTTGLGTRRARTTTARSTNTINATAAEQLLRPEERARLERVASILKGRRRERGAAAKQGVGPGGVRYLSEEPAEGEVHPPFPLHDDWTPRPPRPVESHRPWDARDALVFAPPETYMLDPQQGRLRRVDYTIPALATDAPPPVVSRRRYEGEALVGSYRVIIPRGAYRSIRAPPRPPSAHGDDKAGEEADTVNLEALAEEARARAAVATALAAFPPTVEGDGGVGLAAATATTSVLWEGAAGAGGGGGGGGARRPSVRTDSVSIYAHM